MPATSTAVESIMSMQEVYASNPIASSIIGRGSDELPYAEMAMLAKFFTVRFCECHMLPAPEMLFRLCVYLDF